MTATSHPRTAPPHIIYQPQNPHHTCEGQCDCACASSVEATAVHRQPQPEQAYTLSPSFTALPLIDDYYVAFERDTQPVVLNAAALQIAQHFRQAHRLDDIPAQWHDAWGSAVVCRFLENITTLGLLVPDGHSVPELVEMPTTLSAWLHITDRCNLRCAYCYLPHVRADMAEETGKAAVDATFRSALKHGYARVKLKYAGGEPLLRFDFIAALQRYARAAAQHHDLVLDGVVLSNGTLLTAEMLTTMQALELRLMISLDGLDTAHDQQRFYAGGRGSFADTARAIERALAHGLIPDISITVTGRNAAQLPAVIAWVLERDLPFSLNFYRENEHAASFADLQFEESRMIAGMRAAYRVIEANLPRRSLLAALVDRANLAVSHVRTCGVGQSYLVFDYRGRVAKCQMHMRQTVTTVHADDPLSLIRADTLGIQNHTVEDKEGCRTCEWKHWCTGGCPLVTFRATGRYDVQSPNCNIYKALYPEVVRLEGLRLLKYARAQP